jgi:hypothetical protein
MRDLILWQAFGAATLPFKRAYNQARIQIGLPTTPRMYGVGLVSPWLVLATGCPSLERPEAEHPNQIVFLSAHPLVIVTQGTHHVELADLVSPPSKDSPTWTFFSHCDHQRQTRRGSLCGPWQAGWRAAVP